MQILIDIPDAEYNQIKERHPNICSYADSLIRCGTPLPKGHGRLIDADKLDTRERGNNSQRTMWWKIDCIVKHAPTIVEADKENNNE